LLPAAAEPSSETAQQAEPRTDARIARAAPLPAPARGQPVATGEVRFSIVPWGEIYLDGRRLGAAPPLRDIALQPGLHRIEVRNPGFASHSRIIEIRAGDTIRIRHRFE
jgi:serine/threonine-protein kinase